ncbi:hypothetical protein QTP86_033495 [Hemibagrus guttatus]|nr:hypothetical protein QTP86_033495 [Hemibagrus guttatus]
MFNRFRTFYSRIPRQSRDFIVSCTDVELKLLNIPEPLSYRPIISRSKLVLKLVKTWPAGTISALQDSFECTDWNMFREAATNGHTTDLEEYTSSVTSYISKCIEEVTISKTITTRSNQKPWMTAKVCAKIQGLCLQSWRQGCPKNSTG